MVNVLIYRLLPASIKLPIGIIEWAPHLMQFCLEKYRRELRLIAHVANVSIKKTAI